MNDKLLINRLRKLDLMISALLKTLKELGENEKETKELTSFSIKQSKLFLKTFYGSESQKKSSEGY